MTPLIGKTINQLTPITEVSGSEIIPLSVLDGEGRYVTRGITLDNLFKLINENIAKTNERIDETNSNVAETESKITETDKKLSDAVYEIDSKINQTNESFESKISYSIAQVDSKISYVDTKNSYQDAQMLSNLTYIAGNSYAITQLDNEVRRIANILGQQTTYEVTYSLVTNFAYSLDSLSSYTHANFAENEKTDDEQSEQINAIKELHNDPWETYE